MARAPFQVLVYLYCRTAVGELQYALFQRANGGFWQGVAGGGEDDETPPQAAIRETQEETGLFLADGWLQLQTIGTVPVTEFSGTDHWSEDLYVIPIHCFGVMAEDQQVTLSHEHTQMAWLSFETASQRVKFDSDRIALWELNQRLQGKGPRDA